MIYKSAIIRGCETIITDIDLNESRLSICFMISLNFIFFLRWAKFWKMAAYLDYLQACCIAILCLKKSSNLSLHYAYKCYAIKKNVFPHFSKKIEDKFWVVVSEDVHSQWVIQQMERNGWIIMMLWGNLS